MQRRINEAEGKAEEILAIATASAESIEKIAAVFSSAGGDDALKMQVREKYIDTMRSLEQSKIILPANVARYDGWVKNLGLDDIVKDNSASSGSEQHGQ